MSEPLHDLAHIGHAELLTPFPDQSLAFFTDLFGMEIEAREGESVYLRGGASISATASSSPRQSSRASGTSRSAPGARRRSSGARPRSR